MKNLACAGVSILMVLALAGCGGDACEDAAERLADKFEECDFPTGGGDDDDSGDTECTDEDAEAAECFADCAEDAPCGALNGTDLDAAAEYGMCAQNCTN